jgi:hypothetical protein
MKDNRKKWIPPQLIVLGRGTPEENVLRGCKTSTLTGNSAKYTGCIKKNVLNTKCNGGNCSVISKTS